MSDGLPRASNASKKPVVEIPDQIQHKPDVQPLKMARGLKFRIQEVEGLYYLCSENKGADKLRSHCAADLRLRFRICTKQVFLMTRLGPLMRRKGPSDSKAIRNDTFVCFACLFYLLLYMYVHGKQVRSVILTTLYLNKPPRGSLPVLREHSYAIN